ncbi:PucR family transcriptional regulator [Rhodococcus ruber]|uniref:PucR family transcriptional regulator n=2 Tax=Rhodococcus TaxID=1827 RepID=UPI001F252943|nr:helix-turn-helix domain-containing protein [Rhodococcus ruber]
MNTKLKWSDPEFHDEIPQKETSDLGKTQKSQVHLVALLAQITDKGSQLSDLVVNRIRSEVPQYSVVPPASHREVVAGQVAGILAGLQEQRTPSPSQISGARELGRRRAAQGIALGNVIEAYHIAYREIWNELLELSRAENAGTSEPLLSVVALLWNWFHRLSAAVAEGHSDELRSNSTTRAVIQREFLHALISGTALQHRALATSLGFDPDGPFQVACIEGFPRHLSARLDEELAGNGGAVLFDDERTVVVLQNVAAPEFLERLHALASTAIAGVGHTRTGLSGATDSVKDAQLVLTRACKLGRSITLAEDWLMAILDNSAAHLRPLLRHGTEVAARNDRLAETLRAFATSGFSLSACARELRVHPNTVKYRLDRWRELTGWDVHDVEGLVASLRCLEG